MERNALLAGVVERAEAWLWELGASPGRRRWAARLAGALASPRLSTGNGSRVDSHSPEHSAWPALWLGLMDAADCGQDELRMHAHPAWPTKKVSRKSALPHFRLLGGTAKRHKRVRLSFYANPNAGTAFIQPDPLFFSAPVGRGSSGIPKKCCRYVAIFEIVDVKSLFGYRLTSGRLREEKRSLEC